MQAPKEPAGGLGVSPRFQYLSRVGGSAEPPIPKVCWTRQFITINQQERVDRAFPINNEPVIVLAEAPVGLVKRLPSRYGAAAERGISTVITSAEHRGRLLRMKPNLYMDGRHVSCDDARLQTGVNVVSATCDLAHDPHGGILTRYLGGIPHPSER